MDRAEKFQVEIECPESNHTMFADGVSSEEFDLENTGQSFLLLKRNYDALSESYKSLNNQLSSCRAIYRMAVAVKKTELQETLSQDINALYLYYVLLKSPESASAYSEQDWRLLFHWTNILSNQFYNRLHEAFPFLSWKALRLCCLMRADFADKDIAIQLSVKEVSIHRMKNRLKAQFPFSLKTVSALEEFIHSF